MFLRQKGRYSLEFATQHGHWIQLVDPNFENDILVSKTSWSWLFLKDCIMSTSRHLRQHCDVRCITFNLSRNVFHLFFQHSYCRFPPSSWTFYILRWLGCSNVQKQFTHFQGNTWLIHQYLHCTAFKTLWNAHACALFLLWFALYKWHILKLQVFLVISLWQFSTCRPTFVWSHNWPLL